MTIFNNVNETIVFLCVLLLLFMGCFLFFQRSVSAFYDLGGRSGHVCFFHVGAILKTNK